jgi:hypothetical protein
MRGEDAHLPIPGDGPMPGGVPDWPGKPPNPGGRPYGDAVHFVSVCSLKARVNGLLTSVRVVRHGDPTKMMLKCNRQL